MALVMKLTSAERWKVGGKARVVRGRLVIASHVFVPESWALCYWQMLQWW